MKWPWVSRSRLDAAIAALEAAETRVVRAEIGAAHLRAESERLDATLNAATDGWKASVRQSDENAKAYTDELLRTHLAEKETKEADLARIRAEVRAEQWEAIAKELIGRGAGRPTPEQAAKSENIVAKKIRDEAGGDPSVAAHFAKLAARLRRDGKSDEEIVGAIGWETTDPPEETSAS